MKVKEIKKDADINRIIKEVVENDESWWGDFVRRHGKKKGLKEIIAACEITDEESTEENLEALQELRKELPNDFEEAAEKIDRKIRILEKRVERRVSEDFGALLRYHRTAKKMSLAQLGRLANISPSYINRFETGERQGPSMAIIEKLAEALEISVGELIGINGDDVDGDEPQSLASVIFSNTIYVENEENVLSRKEKQVLVDLVNLVYTAEWGEDKHKEMFEAVGLIDKIKGMQKKKK